MNTTTADTAVSRCRLQVTAACKEEGGTPLTGKSGMCLACYRACCRPCLTCQDVILTRQGGRPRLKYEYQEHVWDGDSECPRCKKARVVHQGHLFQGHLFQVPCPECKGEGVIFEEPKEKK